MRRSKYVYAALASAFRRTGRSAVVELRTLALTGLLVYSVAGSTFAAAREIYASTYRPLAAPSVLIENATILTATGTRIERGDVLFEHGKLVAIGADITAANVSRVIDATGRYVTPGIIDIHSHLGLSPVPHVEGNSDSNEITNPNTAGVWAEHGVWPQDPGFAAALAGGVTTLQVLPGSANLFGGRSVVLKNVRSVTVQAMKYPGAPYGIKMACGENPKFLYGSERGVAPGTRMGNFFAYRSAFIAAQSYKRKHDRYAEDENSGKPAAEPERDLGLDTLLGVLNGDIYVHVHCYRADEMAMILDLADEFGFRIAAFHHATEAYKIPRMLARKETCAAMWSDWWGFKMEALDGIRENIPMVDAAGACAIVHSDSATGIQHLPFEAARAMGSGRRAGLDMEPEQAVRWLTINPARALGIDDETGSLEAGKAADLVIWSGDPFSTYTRADEVFIDGVPVFQRDVTAAQRTSDFVLGQLPELSEQ